MPKVKKVRKDHQGNISHILLSNGETLNLNRAIKRADQEEIDGVSAVHPKTGKPYLRSDPDGKKKNNLENLPEF